MVSDLIYFLLTLKKWIRLIVLIFYIFCIISLSLLPPDDLPKIKFFEGFDKVVHFIMYFIFSLIYSWYLYAELKAKKVYIAFNVAISWGIFMEIIQFEMHIGRNFSWFDIIANCIGAIAGALFYLYLCRKYLEDVE